MRTPAKLSVEQQEIQGTYDHAELLLNEVGVYKSDFVRAIWDNLLRQTVQLMVAGYQKRFIVRKLEELTTVHARSLKG